MKTVTIRSDNGNRLSVNVIGYERTPNGDFHDSNWIMANIEFAIGAFSGNYNICMLTYEYVSFRDQLKNLYDTLKGFAELDTMEGQIKLTYNGNGRGGIKIEGTLKDRAGDGNKLSFSGNLDQSYIKLLIDDLNELINEYPIIK